MKTGPLFFFFALCCFSTQGLPAQEKAEKTSFFDLIRTDGRLKIELHVNIDSILINKRTNEYFPAVLTFEDREGNEQEWELKVRSRGRFRRSRCEFPPLRLEFDKDDLRAKGMETFDSYKLVTHCLAGSEGNENVMRECLIYRLYEVIAPERSLRSQLVRIRYRDTESRRKITQYGIILEDEKELADRLDSKECEDCYSLPPEALDRENTRRLALFQYMIGNNDWAIKTLRNVMVLNRKEQEKKVVIPYDFDFAGLVSASYALQTVAIPENACGGRIYLGFENSVAELKPTIAYFQERREALRNTIRDFRWLSTDTRQGMLLYLEQFYDCVEAGSMVFLDKSQY